MDPPIVDPLLGDLPLLDFENTFFSFADWLAPTSPGGNPIDLEPSSERHNDTTVNSIPAPSTSTASAPSIFPPPVAVNQSSALVAQASDSQLPPLTAAPEPVFPLDSMFTNSTPFAMPDLSPTGPFSFDTNNTSALHNTNMDYNNLDISGLDLEALLSGYQLAPPSVPSSLEPIVSDGGFQPNTAAVVDTHNSNSPSNISDELFYPEVAQSTAHIEPSPSSFHNGTPAYPMSEQPYGLIQPTEQVSPQPAPMTQSPNTQGSEPQPANATYHTYHDYSSLVDMPCNYVPGIEYLQPLGEEMTYVQHQDGYMQAQPKWKASLTGRNTSADTPPLPTFAELVVPGRVILCMVNEVLIKSGRPPLITEYPAYAAYIQRHREENPHLPIESLEFWASDFPKQYYEEAKAQGLEAHEPEYLPPMPVLMPAPINHTATTGPVGVSTVGNNNSTSALGPSPGLSGTPSLEMGSMLDSTPAPYTPFTAVPTVQSDTVPSGTTPPDVESSTNTPQDTNLVHRSPRQSPRHSPYGRPAEKWRSLPRKDRPIVYDNDLVIGLTETEIADVASRKTRPEQKKLARLYLMARETNKWFALPKELKCSMCKKRDYPCLVPILQEYGASWSTTRAPYCCGCSSNPTDCGLRRVENGLAIAAYAAGYGMRVETDRARNLVFITKGVCPVLPEPRRFPLVSGQIPG